MTGLLAWASLTISYFNRPTYDHHSRYHCNDLDFERPKGYHHPHGFFEEDESQMFFDSKRSPRRRLLPPTPTREHTMNIGFIIGSLRKTQFSFVYWTYNTNTFDVTGLATTHKTALRCLLTKKTSHSETSYSSCCHPMLLF